MNHFDELVDHILRYDPFKTEVIVPTKYCVSTLKSYLKKHDCVFPPITAFYDLKNHPYCHHHSFDWMTMGEIMAMIKADDPTLNFVQISKKAQAIQKIFHECEDEGLSFLDINFLKYDISFLHHVQHFLKTVHTSLTTPWSLFFEGCKNEHKHIVYLDSGRSDGALAHIRHDLKNYASHTIIDTKKIQPRDCRLLETPTLYSQAQLIGKIIRYEMYHGHDVSIVCFNDDLRDMIIHECRRHHIYVNNPKGPRLMHTQGGGFLQLFLLFLKDPSHMPIDMLISHPLGEGCHHLNIKMDQNSMISSDDFFDYIQSIFNQCQVIFPEEDDGYSMKKLIENIEKNYQYLKLCMHEWCDIVIDYLKKNDCDVTNYTKTDQCHIISLLDASLVPCERLILCGLNEKDMPGSPPGDPWISDYMRQKIGLLHQSLFYERQDLHFQSALKAPLIYMTRSQNETMSRYWIQSLKKYGKSDDHQFYIPNKLKKFTYHQPSTVSFESSLLPKVLSPSAIRLFIQNPYGFYLSYVLKIKPRVQKSLKTEQGILLHDLLKQLFDQDNLCEKRIDELLAPIGDSYDEHLFKLHAKAAMMFAIQHPYAPKRLTEWECNYPLPHGVTLKARIDRLDFFDDYIQVIDYKTGQIPTLKSMNEFKEPQMPLLSSMVYHHFRKNTVPSFMVLSHMKDFKCQDLGFDHDTVTDQLHSLINTLYGSDRCNITIDQSNYDDFAHLKRLT